MRKEGLENLVMIVKIEEKRSRERRRIMWMSSLKNRLKGRSIKYQEMELLRKTKNREFGLGIISCILHSGHGT